MGVDYAIKVAYGLIVELKHKTVPEDVQELDQSDTFNFFRQDRFGKDHVFSPHALIYFHEDCTTIYNQKVGWTPFTFMATGVYSGSEYVRGGANIPFVVVFESEHDGFDHIAAKKNALLAKLEPVLKPESIQWIKDNCTFGKYMISAFS